MTMNDREVWLHFVRALDAVRSLREGEAVESVRLITDGANELKDFKVRLVREVARGGESYTTGEAAHRSRIATGESKVIDAFTAFYRFSHRPDNDT